MDEIPHKAKALAILGTGSDVGKSLITAGLCRLLYRSVTKVVPFKAQNMSLNSFVTPDGGEMGRAQVLQAQACGIAPNVIMNPILLKPETDCQSQVIVQGKVWEKLEAQEYFKNKAVLWDLVKASYEELARTSALAGSRSQRANVSSPAAQDALINVLPLVGD